MAAGESAGTIEVEVVYALPNEQTLLRVRVAAGATVAQAIAISGLRERYPDVADRAPRVGVWGKFVSGDTVLQAGDRVEIYRPLAVDPKEARRRRAPVLGKKIK